MTPFLVTGNRKRKRRSRFAPSPHSKRWPTSHGASRISRQRFGLRLWAPALYRFRMPDGRSIIAPPPHPLEKRRIRFRSIAALQNVADIALAFRIARRRPGVRLWAPALYRFLLPDGRSFNQSTSTRARKRRSRFAPSPHSKTWPTSHGASRIARQRPGVRGGSGSASPLWKEGSSDRDMSPDPGLRRQLSIIEMRPHCLFVLSQNIKNPTAINVWRAFHSTGSLFKGPCEEIKKTRLMSA
jgi:hypothetical protein